MAYIVSSIFNTFDTLDDSSLSNKMGMFGKSFAEIKKGYEFLSSQNPNSLNIQNLIGSFRKVSSVNGTLFTKDELSKVASYNNAIQSGTKGTKAFADNLQGCRKEVLQLASDVKSGAVGIGEIEKNANKSSIAMRGLTTVLNMATSALLSMGLSFVISSLYELANAEEVANEKAIESGKNAKTEVDNITSLYEAYQNANDAYQNNTGTKEQLTSATDELLYALDIEKDKIGELVGEYGSLDDAIKHVTLDALIKNREKLQSAYSAAVDQFTDSYTEWYYDAPKSIRWSDGKNKEDVKYQSKFTDYLRRNGFLDNKVFKDISLYQQAQGDNSTRIEFNSIITLEEAMEAYNMLLAMQKGLAENFGQNEVQNSNAYKAITASITELIDRYEELETAQKNQNENEAKILVESSIAQESDIPKTVEQFENYKNKLIETAKASSDFVGSQEEIETAIGEVLYTYNQFKGFMQEPVVKGAKLNDTFGLNDIETAIKRVYKLGDELSKAGQNEIAPSLSVIVADQKNVNQYKKNLDEYAKYFGKTSDELIRDYNKFNEQFSKDNEVSKWVQSLSDEDKGIVFDISVRTDSVANWSLERLQEELNQVKTTGKTTEEQMESLNAIFEDTSDEGFTAGVKKDIDSINSLRDAIKTVNGMTQQDRLNLAMTIPELMPYVSDAELFKQKLNELYKASQKGLDDRFQGQLDSLKETAPAAYEVLDRLKTSLDNLYNSDFNLDISDEIASFNNLWSAMSESVSATGLTADSIANLKDRYGELASFSPEKLFEKTVNGIHLNASALRELEREYDKQKKSEINNQLKTLVNEYEDLGRKINETTDASKKAELVAQQNYLQNQIDEVSTLAAQYDGLTSSYNKWQKAQSATDERNMFEQISNNAEKVQDLIDSGWVSDQEVLAFTQMMTDEDLSGKSIEYILDMYKKGLPTIQKFFDGSTEGLGQFLDTAKEVSDELGKSWVQVDENGNYTFDFGVGGDKDLADAINQMTDLQMSTQQVQILLRALSDAGFDIHLDSDKSGIEGLQRLKTEAEKANDKLLDLGKTNIKFNFEEDTIGDVQAEITSAKKLLDQFKNDKGEIDFNLEGAEEAKTILQTLIKQKQMLTDKNLGEDNIFNIDISNLDTQVANAIELMRQYHTAFNDLDENIILGVDTTEAQNNLSQLASQLYQIPDDVLLTMGIDATQFKKDLEEITSTDAEVDVKANLDTTALGGVNSAIGGASEKVVALVPDSKEVDKETAKEDGGQRTVEYTPDTTELQSVQSSTYGGKRTVVYKPDTTAIDNLVFDPVVIPVSYSSSGSTSTSKTSGGSSNVDGTAWAYGSLGNVAFRTGDWGAKESGKALVGELGEEIWVHDGKYEIVGTNGAEFIPVKKNDIIFSNEQSKQLLEQGKITRGKRRGNAYSRGTGGSAFKRVSKDSSTSSSNSDSSSSSVADDIDKANEEAKEFEETIDWIEIKISRIEQVISDLSKTSENVYKKWADRNDALRKDISKTTEEIDIQKKAYDRYTQEANSVGLDSNVAKDVREGKIDITKITDEDLSKQIKEYQQWYEKALSCKYAINDLEESVSKLYATAFDNVQTRFDTALSAIENEKNTINEYITQTETMGHIVNSKLYQTLADKERKNINQLEKEKVELIKAMADAVNSGAIKEGSEEWHRMSQEIANVTLEVEKGTTQLMEYANSIRQIKWDVFDLVEKRISNIATEADFLINLLKDSKLYTKNGKFTYEGSATMGLHTSNYDTYMKQAEDYSKAVEELNEKIYGNYKEYQEILSEFNSLKLENPNQTVFGNIDLNNRQVLKWTEQTLNQYKKELQSWYDDAYDDWDSFVKDMDGSIATVIGSSSEFDGVEIAFSPMLQTDHGAQLLSADTVYKYIDSLVSQMPEGWTNEDLLKLDAKGLDVGGIKIKNLIADIGDTAITTGEAMHYLGKDGALALAKQGLKDISEADKEEVERRDELLKLQQESILAAQAEKMAVRDMVAEGIEIELDALKELIDKKKEALDNTKDLYEYNKKVKKQTKEIANLEKQLQAYSGDQSEETKATVQKLKVSLESAKEDLTETQMDKFISDSKAMLDQFYTDYSTVLNRRLDNIDKLFEEMINAVNSQSDTIASTLYNTAESVGYKTSQAFNDTWSQAYSSIKGDSDTRLTQVSETLNTLINEKIITEESAKDILDKLGKGDVTNIDKVLTEIQNKVNSGDIDQTTANKIRASMAVGTDIQEAFNSLQLVDKLKSEDAFTTEDVTALRKAIVGGESGDIPTATETRLSQLLADNKLTLGEGSTLISALTGKDKDSVYNGLAAIKQAYEEGKLTEQDATNLFSSVINGENSKLYNIAETLNKAFGGDNSLMSDVISAITGEKSDEIQQALSIIDDLEKAGVVDENWKRSTINALISDDKQALSNSLSALDNANAANATDAQNIATLQGLLGDKIKSDNSTSATYAKAVDEAITTVKNSLQTLVNKGIITQEQADAILKKIKTGNEEVLKQAKQEVKTALLKGIEAQKIDVSEANNLMTDFNDGVDHFSDVLNTAADRIDGILRGDANEDGVVSVRDASTIATAAAKGVLDSLPDAANYNGDNKVDVRDAAAIARAMANQANKDNGKTVVTNYSNGVAKNENATSLNASNNVSKSVKENSKYDFNSDGTVGKADLTYLEDVLSGKRKNTRGDLLDVNGDGKITARDLSELKKILKLEKGKKRLSSNTIAWTQENGTEYIIRPSDGAILTPLARNDSVLNAQASSNIWNMATDPEKFIKENMGINNIEIPVTSGTTNNSCSNDISITLPNVQNYQEFKYALQHDKNFEGFMRSVTVDRLFGKSSLRKYKM